MAFNGSGTFNRDNGTNSGATTWQLDRDAAIKITALNHDLHDQQIADGLTNCVTKDGQTTITANLPMAGFLHTNVGNATARNHYAAAGQVQDSSLTYGGTSTGGANVYNITLTPAITAYATGQMFVFKTHQANTGAATLNVNSVGAKSLKKNTGNSLDVDDILNGVMVTVIYDGTDFILLGHDYPYFDTWTPTYTGSASMTYTSVTTSVAKYEQIGKRVSFHIEAFGTVGGTPDHSVEFTLPVTAVDSLCVFAASWIDGGSVSQAGIAELTSTTKVQVRKYDASNWTAGTNRTFTCAGIVTGKQILRQSS